MLHLTDRVAVTWRKTSDGFLAAQPRVSRTGVQVYAGREVGRSDLERVRVYRPADEVFSKAAMHSFAHRPLTNDHPPEPVTADNWKKYAIGGVGDEVLRDGNFVRVPMLMMDAQAIKDVNGGKRELSVGYTCDLKWQGGVTEDGEHYDAIQKDIRVNHIALVKAARGGQDLCFGDEDEDFEDANPYHKGAGPGGGQFTSGPNGGGGSKGAKKTDIGKLAHKIHKSRAGEDRLEYGYGQLAKMYGLSTEEGRELQIELHKKAGSVKFRPFDSADDAITADDLDTDGDNEGEQYMAKLTIDSIDVDMTDTAVQVVGKAIKTRDNRIEELEEAAKKKKKVEEDAATADAVTKTQMADKDKSIAELTTRLKDAQLTPDALDKMVVDRVAVIGKAKVVLGDKLVIDGKSNDDIRKQVVDAHMGKDVATINWDAKMVQASFDAIALKAAPTNDGAHDIAHGFNNPGPRQELGDARIKAYDQYEKDLQNRYKGKAA